MTPKQRREQDILKRKTSNINKKYPKISEPLEPLVGEAIKKFKEENPTSSIREGEYSDMGLEAAAQGAAEGAVGEAVGRKKGGKIKTHKMPGGKMMKNSDMKKKKKMGGGMMSDESFQYSKGGMVRGQGIAIKGTKFKGIF